MTNRDSLFVEARNIFLEMKGISPKTETYQKLNTRLKELKEMTGGMKIHSLSPSGTPVRVRPEKGTLVQVQRNHKTKSRY